MHSDIIINFFTNLTIFSFFYFQCLFKLLWYQRKINRLRVIIMGVVPEYRSKGLDAVFYVDTYQNAVAKGYNWGEFSWILENNDPMNAALKNIGASVYKTYRIYEKTI